MENSFKGVIDNAGSIVIFLPVNPRLDYVASALSLFMAAKDVKQIQIVSASPMTVGFNRLIGVDKISESIGNKNLVLSFDQYDANGIERVSYDIVENQFKLTVIPKSGINPPKAEQVRVTYEGVSADTVILFGGETDKDFPQLASKGLESAKMYHVGTKPLVVDPSRVVFTFAQDIASTSELTFYLLNECKLNIDGDVATNLLMGIEEATDNYKTPSASAETFEITAALIRMGGRRRAGESIDKNKFPPGSIPQTVQAGVKPAPVEEKMPLPVSVTDFADFTGEAPPPGEEPPPPISEVVEAEGKVEDDLNPPDDWLQPKVYRGTSLN